MSPRTDTQTLASALDILASDIESQDGIANATIREAAARLRELELERDDSAGLENAVDVIMAAPIPDILRLFRERGDFGDHDNDCQGSRPMNLEPNPLRDLNNAAHLPAAECPRCEAGDDNFARLLRNREWLLEENRTLQKQIASLNDQILEAQAVIRAQRQNLRDDDAELQRVQRELNNALALLRLHK